MKMKELKLFLILLPVDYLKEIIIPETNKILKHPMDLGEFTQWMGCWFYMGFWVGILNRKNWWSTVDLTMTGVAPFRLNNYVSRTRF